MGKITPPNVLKMFNTKVRLCILWQQGCVLWVNGWVPLSKVIIKAGRVMWIYDTP